jgi:hypothetical protein
MYTSQYSQVTHSRSSNRCVHGSLVAEKIQRLVLCDWFSDKSFSNCVEKSSPRFVCFRRVFSASMKFIEYSSLKRPRKHCVHLWMKQMSAHPLSLARSLVTKCVPAVFHRATTTIRSLYRLFMDWWGRPHCPGLGGVVCTPARVDSVDYQYPVSRIFKLPQFHMGADPIIMSAIRWQGCHCSNHGGK